MSRSDERLVYSSELGSICPECQRAKALCQCKALANAVIHGGGDVKVRRETKGRGGKTVSTISGLKMNTPQLDTLLKELKKRCGTGGTLKDGVIEIQGDHVTGLLEELGKRGIKAKKAGG